MNKIFEYEIGIGVTEHNRPEVLKQFLKHAEKYMPKKAKLVIVDDASTIPVEGATYRFEENVGIARAKNKCLELLQDCRSIFLFDSDCWPNAKDWWKPYVESKEPHLCYIFENFVNRPLNDCVRLYEESDLVAYSHARGCMLYIDNKVLDVVGGMDTRYKRWGYEHVDYSNRIFNAGLTRFRYQDIPDSSRFIYSMDEHEEVSSTVSIAERQPYLKEMKPHFDRSFSSSEYCPFKDTDYIDPNDTSNVIITSYFNKQVDPQRGTHFAASFEPTRKLAESLGSQRLIVLHDCLSGIDVPDNVKLVEVETSMNPYFQRWVSEYAYLRDNPDINKVFLVDATDVEMLRSPFVEMVQGKIYVGNEPANIHNNWMISNHRIPFLLQFFRRNASKQLLNCGIIGGSRKDVLRFLLEFNKIYFDNRGNVGPFDMGLFNFVAYEHFSDQIVHGSTVNTKFKAFEANNKVAWFKHK